MTDDRTEASGARPTIDNTPGRRYVLAEEQAVSDLVPTVWHFKTEWMEFVGPDGMAEWEEAMRTKVGIPMDARPAFRPGCATTSGSGDGWDDSDYWGNGC